MYRQDARLEKLALMMSFNERNIIKKFGSTAEKEGNGQLGNWEMALYDNDRQREEFMAVLNSKMFSLSYQIHRYRFSSLMIYFDLFSVYLSDLL